MKKTKLHQIKNRQLKLDCLTLRILTTDQLAKAAGGASALTCRTKVEDDTDCVTG